MGFFRRKISIQNWNGFYAVYAKKSPKKYCELLHWFTYKKQLFKKYTYMQK